MGSITSSLFEVIRMGRHQIGYTTNFARSQVWGERMEATSPLPYLVLIVWRHEFGHITHAYLGPHCGKAKKVAT